MFATPSEKAREILNEHWDRKLPVNVEAIAKKVGMELRKIPHLPYSGEFAIEDGKPVCIVNASDAEVRQRFTIAHEIGHFILKHDPSYRDGPEQFSTDNKNPREVAANRFAAELLMPANAIRLLVFEKGISDVIQLALKANVSQVA
ncbi:MAG TPA: ImmA/IrrE family metallo-endopeptidase, partial [Burkholderiales bacterium]|nr:ImmA/IrrE family metallo-endopeptidase [Burkholderiales bacterium]